MSETETDKSIHEKRWERKRCKLIEKIGRKKKKTENEEEKRGECRMTEMEIKREKKEEGNKECGVSLSGQYIKGEKEASERKGKKKRSERRRT